MWNKRQSCWSYATASLSSDGKYEFDAVEAVARIANLFDLKTGWVKDLSFSLLQFAGHNDAATWLQQYDASVEAGRLPHRVAQRFGSLGGEFRSVMKQWATGTGMQEALALELLSYQLSKLDDTWQEATHKNVGQYCRTTPAAKIPRLAARQRLLQNLELVNTSHRGRVDLRRFLPFWKAIDQSNPMPSSSPYIRFIF